MAGGLAGHFEELGFPLRNARWSWGAQSEKGVLLRTWEDHLKHEPDQRVVVLRPTWDANRATRSAGRGERCHQLAAIMRGQSKGYVVIAKATDVEKSPRAIQSFRSDVYPITGFEVENDGTVWALLGPATDASDLVATNHVEAAVPVLDGLPASVTRWMESAALSPDEQRARLRHRLIEVASDSARITYGQLMKELKTANYPLQNLLTAIGRDCVDAGEPILSALVVQTRDDGSPGSCGPGFFSEFAATNDEHERHRCYAWWGHQPVSEESLLQVRAQRFANARPEQARFRKEVFLACAGRCVVSGCDVSAVLDAAHLAGRDWRKGHNSAQDGVLLRKDLHALYDSGLLWFDDDGRARFNGPVLEHYRPLIS